MIRIENVSYKELLGIDADDEQRTRDVIGIDDNGNLLLIRDKEVDTGSSIAQEFFLINDEEYLQYLRTAAGNLRLQKSIAKGITVLEVCYRGMYFKAGSSVQYIIHEKECSIFTSDASLAEEYDFGRIDKFEHEKTVRIQDCDAVRITHMDAETICVQKEFSPSVFEDSICL